MEDLLSNILIIISCIVGIFILKKFFKIIYNKIFYNMSNQVITIGYLKDFVGDVVKINSSYTDMFYCPTYAELTNGNLVLNFKDNASPLSIVNGIYVNPNFTSTSTYANNQLVIREHLQLKYTELQSISVSASKTSLSCCGESTTLSTIGYFKLITKSEGGNLSTSTTQTSQSVSASYSDDKSFTTINGSNITFSKNSVNYPTSTSAAERSTTVNASYTYSFVGGKSITKTNTVTIIQGANNVGNWINTITTTNSISVSPTSMSFTAGGGTKSYSVTRNYTQYQEKYDSCSTVMDTNNYITSSTVTPSEASVSGAFTCTKSNVSVVAQASGAAARSGTLTITYDGKTATCSLSQAANVISDWTKNGDAYSYSYSVSVSPWENLSCDGGTTYATATLSWKQDYVKKDSLGNVITSKTENESSNVTNSTTWLTDRGSISSTGTLSYPSSTSNGTTKTTVTGKYGSYTDTDYITQVDCYEAPDCMTINYTINGNVNCTVYFKTTNGTQQGYHSVSSSGNQQLCNIAVGTELVVSCSDTAVTISGDKTFTYTDDSTAFITLTQTSGGGTTELECNTPNGSYANANDFRIDFSQAVTSDVTVTVKLKDHNCNVVETVEIDVSNGKKTGYGYNCHELETTTGAYFEITDVTPSSDSNYIYWGGDCDYDDSGDCTKQECSCTVSSISVSPTSFTYTGASQSKTFTVTVNDNGCESCSNGFLVYKGSTYVTSGVSSFSLTNGDGAYTIRSKDNTGKTATLSLTKYNAPTITYRVAYLDNPICYCETQNRASIMIGKWENGTSNVDNIVPDVVVPVNVYGGTLDYDVNADDHNLLVTWNGSENTSADDRIIKYIVSSTTWNVSGTVSQTQYGTATTVSKCADTCKGSSEKCVQPTIKFSTTNTWGDSNINSQQTDTFCSDSRASVVRGTNFYYGYGYMGHNHTFDVTLSIEGIAAEFTHIECTTDSGNGDTGSMGFTYSGINPDVLLSGGEGMCEIYGKFTYLDYYGNPQEGDFSITITIIEI